MASSSHRGGAAPYRSREGLSTRSGTNTDEIQLRNIPRADGQLAMTRAFGDKKVKKHITAKPDVGVKKIDKDVDFLILASDGLWKVMSNQEACDCIYNITDAQEAAEELIKEIVIWFIIPAIRSSHADHNNNALVLIVLLQYIPRLYLIFPLSSQIIKATGVVAKTAWARAAYNLVLYMLASYVMTTFMPPPPAATYLAFHPQDNNIIAIGMEDSTIQIYNVRVDEVKTKLKGHQKPIRE
ncbi:hypothetical protein POM88_045804 [Heracleum sosnowskyi]|uniref:PPM-type phosphatase domain-containing protein n=1 Tax=Heracleum sosnowskyi TaxID=360622 RepID=A0AAD8H841_9APIA|nr:hypothetical protein POM88_045804 [Heracleum sosnowskyi]